MVEEVYPSIFRMEIPIPRSPLKATNSYVIKGDGRTLLIDSGQNCPESLAAIRAGLAELAVDLSQTDIFVTHMHADHSGLLPFLNQAGTRFFASAADAEVINHMFTEADPLESLRIAACENGFTPEEAVAAIQRHPGNDVGSRAGLVFETVVDGDVFSAGPFRFRCVATPGHTAGHLCYDLAERDLLFSGDHVMAWSTSVVVPPDGSMADYMASLDRLTAIGPRAYLPGHGGPVVDGSVRVAELKRHRGAREAAILRALDDKERTIEEIVAAVYIGLDPALAEAAALSVKAHTVWLEDRGLVRTSEGRLSRS